MRPIRNQFIHSPPAWAAPARAAEKAAAIRASGRSQAPRADWNSSVATRRMAATAAVNQRSPVQMSRTTRGRPTTALATRTFSIRRCFPKRPGVSRSSSP